MIVGLKPYPEYKDSGVPWLGEVPEHWETLPALAAYRRREVKNTGMVERTVLSLSYGRIIVKPPEKLRGLVPESFETYQIVDPGNIIVRTTDLQNDQTSLRIGHSQHRGIITSAYMCLDTTDRVSNEFGYQFLNAYDLLKIIYGFGSGLRQNLDFSDIKRMPVLVPPLSEQAAIVRFLDHADRRIRHYVRAKQKLIKLLEEQKQAIIHRAVTRGLDTNVRLKPSGIDWLGDIPEQWEVRKLHSLFGRHGSGTTPAGDHYFGGDVPWVMTGDLKDGVLTRTKRTVTRKALRDVPALRLYPAGSLLVAMYGATIGKTGILSIEACTNQACCVLADPRHHANVAYLQAVVNIARPRLVQESYGGGQPNINAEVVRSLRVPVPPRPEQDSIVIALGDTTKGLDETIDRADREMALLREYRTRLIADVVTGKIDVREAAAQLPYGAEEPEPLVEPHVPTGIEEETADDLDEELEEAEA